MAEPVGTYLIGANRRSALGALLAAVLTAAALAAAPGRLPPISVHAPHLGRPFAASRAPVHLQHAGVKATFDGKGASIGAAGAGWHLGLHLSAVGRGDKGASVRRSAPLRHDETVRYNRGRGVDEW